MNAWQLYWILRLDGIKDFLVGMGGIFLVIAIISSILSWFIWEQGFKQKKPIIPCLLTSLIIVPLLMFTINIFIPTTKQMAVIIVAPKIINNEQVQQIPDKVLKLANDWLDELMPKDKK